MARRRRLFLVPRDEVVLTAEDAPVLRKLAAFADAQPDDAENAEHLLFMAGFCNAAAEHLETEGDINLTP